MRLYRIAVASAIFDSSHPPSIHPRTTIAGLALYRLAFASIRTWILDSSTSCTHMYSPPSAHTPRHPRSTSILQYSNSLEAKQLYPRACWVGCINRALQVLASDQNRIQLGHATHERCPPVLKHLPQTAPHALYRQRRSFFWNTAPS